MPIKDTTIRSALPSMRGHADSILKDVMSKFGERIDHTISHVNNVATALKKLEQR